MNSQTVSQPEHIRNTIAELYGDDGRPRYRALVDEMRLRARLSLGEPSFTRIDSAVKMVLAGDVELLPESGARVASGSNGSKRYEVVNGVCPCKDFARAPQGMCKHRLAYGIAKRVQQALDEQAAAEPQPDYEAIADAIHTENGSFDPATAQPTRQAATAEPEDFPRVGGSATVTLDIGGRKVSVKLWDRDDSNLLTRLQALLDEHPLPDPEGEAPAPDPAYCAKHQVVMKQYEKDGRSWYSHRDGDTWCRGGK